MKRVRLILGLVTGLLLVASSGAHSILGWKSLADRLAVTNVPADLQSGLRIGWMFAGAAMLTFGLIVVWTFVGRLRGERRLLVPVVVIGLLYLAFGAWSLAASGGNLFFLMVFVVPGALLGIAANGHDR